MKLPAFSATPTFFPPRRNGLLKRACLIAHLELKPRPLSTQNGSRSLPTALTRRVENTVLRSLWPLVSVVDPAPSVSRSLDLAPPE